MRLAVVTDSHHAVDELGRFMDDLKGQEVNQLVHAGDFAANDVTEIFRRHQEITCYVAIGNCDYGEAVAALRRMPHVRIDTVVRFEPAGRHFAVSPKEGIAQRTLTDQPVDVFFHGHTHQTRIDDDRHPLVPNPGSLLDGHGFLLLELPGLTIDRRFRF